MKDYANLQDKEKIQMIQERYVKKNQSFREIAKDLNTYPNRILRDAKKFNIPIKSKSQAQKNALKSGKHKHPTKGRVRSEQEKSKIGIGVMKNWENMSDKELNNKKLKAKKIWEQKSVDEKNNMLIKANQAIRESSKKGSKLEYFVLQHLISEGFKVDFHKEQFLVNTKLQIDLFLPRINIAIEVDGPSHFAPVWGEKSLQRNIEYDKKKTGLILGKGYKLIRIKQQKDFSKSRASVVCHKLSKALNNIDTVKTKVIEIGDT
jgi:very-short-patch-repair endonuclease